MPNKRVIFEAYDHVALHSTLRDQVTGKEVGFSLLRGRAQATVQPKAVSASVRDEPHRDEYHVSGLDHYIDSRLAGELFRID